MKIFHTNTDNFIHNTFKNFHHPNKNLFSIHSHVCIHIKLPSVPQPAFEFYLHKTLHNTIFCLSTVRL